MSTPLRRGVGRRRAGTLLSLGLLALGLLVPAAVSAHAALDDPTPADGATVEGSLPEIAGTFTQDIDPDGSSLELRDVTGDSIATGGPDPSDVRRMVIAGLPELAPGGYEVRWTTHSAEDGEIARGTWRFSVTPAPTPSPPAPTQASATPVATPDATETATPEPAVTPAPTPTGPDDGASNTADAIIPIVVGLGVVVAAGALLLRRRSRPPEAR
jgi:copper resistance protein C